MASAVLNTILTQVKAAVDGLTLTLDGNPVPCAVRKLPRYEEGIDAGGVVVCVTPDTAGESARPWDSEDHFLVVQPVVVTFLLAGSRDFTTTRLPEVLLMREKVRRLFQGGPLNGAPTVFDTETAPDPVYDRRELQNDWEVSGVRVKFWSCEQRTN